MPERTYRVTVYLVNEGRQGSETQSYQATNVELTAEGRLKISAENGGEIFEPTAWGSLTITRVGPA